VFQVQTFPEFPGLEGHYLRALLARLTAGSQVSPQGYFKTNRFGDEEEGEDEDYEDEDEEPPGLTFDLVEMSINLLIQILLVL